MSDNAKVTEEELARNQAATPGAKRVTLGDLEANIASVFYTTGLAMAEANGPVPEEQRQDLGLLTVCLLVLRNGFTLIGKSACADPAMYNRDVGSRLAREDAVRQIWPLMGYALKQEIYLTSLGSHPQGLVEDSYKARARQELSELTDKIGKLDSFIGGQVQFRALDATEQNALIAQANAMRTYQKVLADRVSRF